MSLLKPKKSPVLKRLPQDVFIQKEYQERLERGLANPTRLRALYGSNFWREPPTEQIREFCKITKNFLSSDEAHITLVSDTHQRIIASTEVQSSTEDKTLDWSVCQYLVAAEDAVPISNALEMLRVCDIKAVANGHVVAYLGVPLMTRTEQIIGGLCVVQYTPREWTEMDLMLLSKLAGSLMNMYELAGVESGKDE